MNRFFPYFDQNYYDGTRAPSPVHNNSAAFWFWCRALYQRAASTIEFKLPKSWNRARDLFEAILFNRGYLAVFNTKEYGVTFQPCTLYGYDWFYQPTQAVISNPKLSKTFTIGEDCSLIKLTPDWRGIYDIIFYSAERLATLDSAINMAITNSKFAYVLGAKNKASSAAIKMIFDKINKGESTIVYDQRLTEGLGDESPFEFLDRGNLKNSYITTELLNDFQTILNQFDTEIGIPTIPAEKRERMISDEANSKFADASSRITLWDECLSNSIDEVNRMFGTSISYKFKYLDMMNASMNDPQEGEEEAPSEDDDSIKEVLRKWALA